MRRQSADWPRIVRTSYIRRKFRRKAIAWQIYRTYKSPESLESYKKIAFDCKSAIYSHILRRESHLVDSGNTGKFFRNANKKCYSKSEVEALYRNDGSLTIDSMENASTADVLEKFYD
jgi:type IV secretory pathway VirB4 component